METAWLSKELACREEKLENVFSLFIKKIRCEIFCR